MREYLQTDLKKKRENATHIGYGYTPNHQVEYLKTNRYNWCYFSRNFL